MGRDNPRGNGGPQTQIGVGSHWGTFSRTQKPGHAHRQALGVLIKKMSVPHFQLYFFSPKPRFCFCELLWFWKWRRFLNFYPMKTISSRKSEVESQVGHSQIRNELIETSPTSHRNLCFRVANSEIQLRAQNSLSGSAARQRGEERQGTEGESRTREGAGREGKRETEAREKIGSSNPHEFHRTSLVKNLLKYF